MSASDASPGKRDYHHGNLRAALLSAGIALLDEVGWDGLSLRACAARAGVSHAAPAHHFGNKHGLLTALAAIAFRRFHDMLAAHRAAAPDEKLAKLRAAGAGYVRFAKQNPGLFRLMFGEAALNHADPEFEAARRAAYRQLGEIVAPFLPVGADEAADHRLRLLVWSSVHGYAHLLLSGQLDRMQPSDDGLSHLPDLAALVAGDGEDSGSEAAASPDPLALSPHDS
ncbi:MAG: TetR/AcrR family transcriptional regulator [Alphaproteobacteria bacterium]|nr:TetR/AcrR family transcriptional regulator [Alphaproteobacteria bacterium]